VHLRPHYQASRIDQHVALAAIHTFRSVVPANAADAGRPDGLAIDDASARLGITPDGRAELLAQDGVQVLPGAVQTPQTEVVVGGLPRRELMREQSPGTATPNDVEDSVQDFADRVEARSAKPLGWR